MNDIVVTARRRRERLQDVPVAITAISGATLQSYNITSIQDAAKLVPNLLVSQSISGTGAAIFLRGVGTSTLSRAFDQSVSINIDNVQVSRGNAINIGYLDMDQFEVLRGPQALYFGKNATGGIISITSRDPGPTTEFSALTGYEFESRQAYGEVVASGPVSDSLGIRFAARASREDGFFRNQAVAYQDPRGWIVEPGPSRYPFGKELEGRLTIKYTPTDDFTARLKVFLANVDGQPATRQLQYCSLGTPRPSFGFIDSADDCKVNDTLTSYRAGAPYVQTLPYAGDGTPYSDYRTFLPVLDLTLNRGKVSLNSISAYYFNSQRTLASYQGGRSIGIDSQSYKAVSQELRLNSHFDLPINGTIGAYYQHSDNPVFNASTIGINTPIDPATGKVHSYEESIDSRSDAYSLFGDLNWKIARGLELDGGARVTWESRYARLGMTYVNPVFLAFYTPGRFLSGTVKSDNVSPQVTLTYKPNSDVTFFTGYRTGYKSGGFNTQQLVTKTNQISQLIFKPEKAKGVDAGVKASLLDRRLAVNGTIYSFDYTDLQVQVYDPTTITFNVGNAGLLRTQGVELETSYDLRHGGHGFQLRGSASYNDARYKDYVGGCYAGQSVAAGCDLIFANGRYQSQDYAGKHPPRAPSWVLTAGGNYTAPVSASWTFQVSADINYTSSFYLLDALNPHAVQKPYALLNASARLYSRSGLEFSLIGRNLTNKIIAYLDTDQALSNGGTGTGTPNAVLGDLVANTEPGRSIAVQLTVHF